MMTAAAQNQPAVPSGDDPSQAREAANNPDERSQNQNGSPQGTGQAGNRSDRSPRDGAAGANEMPELNDDSLAEAIREKLEWDSSVSSEKVEVSVRDGNVTLAGEVGSYDQVRRAAMVARSRSGVRSVTNNLTVAAGDMSDEEIRTQIQQAIEDDPTFVETGIKAEVADGKVTLTGQTQSRAVRRQIEDMIGDLAGVRSIDNQIKTAPGVKRSDSEIQEAMEHRFRNDAWLAEGDIRIEVSEGTATLSGTVASADALERARERAQPFVHTLDTSGLRVEPRRAAGTPEAGVETPTVSDSREGRQDARRRSSDEIREAVREALSEDSRFAGREIDIEVEDGRVTLSGQVRNRLLKSEAVRLARNTAGVNGVTDRIEVSVGDQVDAEALGERIARTLGRNSELRGRQIESEYRDGTVVLSGTVGSGYARNKAESLVSGLDGVREVENRIEVEGDGNTGFTYYDYYGFHDYSDRAVNERDESLGDDELKAKVEREFFWSWYVDGGDIEVNVTDGTVVLTGEVDDLAEKQAAERNAREAGAFQVENRLDIAQN